MLRQCTIMNLLTSLAGLALGGAASAAQHGSVTTTLYVGQHFEMRDHDQPTKYVFNGTTRVAEVIGSLSTNPRIQRLRVYPGWNLCSPAVSGPFPAEGGDVISSAYQWNPATSGYSRFDPHQNAPANTVIWIKASTNATVTALGTYSDPVPPRVQGQGGYLPGAGLEVWSPKLQDPTSSWDFDAATAQWMDHLAGELSAASGLPPVLAPGQAVYIEPAAAASLDIPDPALRIRYYHQDHLGSSSAVTDAHGDLVEETAFYAFGLPRIQYRPRGIDESYQFTQKERDQESGLDYFEMRFLAAGLARFASPDLKYACPDRLRPVELSALVATPQDLNLYAYVRNAPLRFTDPSGEDGIDSLKNVAQQKLDDSSNSEAPPKAAPPEAEWTSTLRLKTRDRTFVVPLSGWSLGVTSGKKHTDVRFTTSTDEKTSRFFFNRVTQESPDAPPLSGEIEIRRTVNGHSEVVARYKLTGIHIMSYQIGGKRGDPHPTETIGLTVEKLDVSGGQQTVQQRKGATESPDFWAAHDRAGSSRTVEPPNRPHSMPNTD